MDNTKELTHISLCAGYGGIDIGLRRAIGAIRTIAFSEIEGYAVANLVAKIEKGLLDEAPIWSNLKTFPWERFYGKVDILSGGFPCQPFSAAGRRAGDEDPRHLWPYILRGIRRLGRPPIVFLENVEGILSSKIKAEGWSDPIGTPVLLHVFRELEKVGYTTTAGVFSAVEVSAPHQRKRVFILAVSNELTRDGRDIVTKLINRKELAHTEGIGNSRDCGAMDKKTAETTKQDDGTFSVCSSAVESGSTIERFYSKEYRTAYPAFRGQEQYDWEAPRTAPKSTKLADPISKRTQVQTQGNDSSESMSECRTQGLSESEMGGTVDGASCRLDKSDLFTSHDNITDELRLLGNGVVPDCATKAFKTLWKKLVDTTGTHTLRKS